MKLTDPKILIGAGVIIVAIIILVMVISGGGDPTGGHGHTH
jgi:hypothetical protein